MNYSCTISVTEQYLHAVIHGINTVANVNRYLAEIANAVEEHRCGNVLIEEQLTGSGLDPFDIFEVIRTHAKYARSHKLRIAYIDLNRDHHRTTVAFAENLANILGVNVKVFPDADVAVQWLTAEP